MLVQLLRQGVLAITAIYARTSMYCPVQDNRLLLLLSTPAAAAALLLVLLLLLLLLYSCCYCSPAAPATPTSPAVQYLTPSVPYSKDPRSTPSRVSLPLE